MEKAITGRGAGMTQVFDADGKAIPATAIEAGPYTVVQKKTEGKGDYNAVQLGYDDVAERRFTKSEPGHLKRVGDARKRALKEFKLTKAAEMNADDEVKADMFAEGDRVGVAGTIESHGYRGIIKCHSAHRLKGTRGSGPVVRHAGSIGANSDSPRIFRGKIGTGQMGNEQITVLNLDMVKMDAEPGILVVRGAIPGPKGDIVCLRNPVTNVKEKGAAAGISSNPQEASARVNPQKASARNK